METQFIFGQVRDVFDEENVHKLIEFVNNLSKQKWIPQLSDLYVLMDLSDYSIVAYMLLSIVKAPKDFVYITYIDTLVRGQDYANYMMDEYAILTGDTPIPFKVPESSKGYWKRYFEDRKITFS